MLGKGHGGLYKAPTKEKSERVRGERSDQVCLLFTFSHTSIQSYMVLLLAFKVAGAGMEVLTLARYILETSLLHYEFVVCSPSKIAAAALSLSFKMKKCCEWDSTLVYHTGYREDELKELVISLNKIISEPATAALQTVHSKYSHPVFFEVAKIPSIKIEE